MAPLPFMAHMRCPLSVKAVSEQGVFSGYASVFNLVDSHQDMVMPGAFAQCLKAQNDAFTVKLLWQHRTDEPIGFFRVIREDGRGLYVEAQLSLEVQRAREAYALLKSGAIEGMSIGYNVADYRVDANTGVRQLLQLDLWEVSLVTFPANQAAQVLRVKDRVAVEAEMLKAALDRAVRVLA